MISRLTYPLEIKICSWYVLFIMVFRSFPMPGFNSFTETLSSLPRPPSSLFLCASAATHVLWPHRMDQIQSNALQRLNIGKWTQQGAGWWPYCKCLECYNFLSANWGEPAWAKEATKCSDDICDLLRGITSETCGRVWVNGSPQNIDCLVQKCTKNDSFTGQNRYSIPMDPNDLNTVPTSKKRSVFET
jgi:hypothetical protein